MKKISISENRLKQIVKESTKKVLKESGPSVHTLLIEAAEKLWQVQESGLIAFTSPAPSSTEQELVNAVKDAEHLTYKAVRLYEQLYGQF